MSLCVVYPANTLISVCILMHYALCIKLPVCVLRREGGKQGRRGAGREKGRKEGARERSKKERERGKEEGIEQARERSDGGEG